MKGNEENQRRCGSYRTDYSVNDNRRCSVCVCLSVSLCCLWKANDLLNTLQKHTQLILYILQLPWAHTFTLPQTQFYAHMHIHADTEVQVAETLWATMVVEGEPELNRRWIEGSWFQMTPPQAVEQLRVRTHLFHKKINTHSYHLHNTRQWYRPRL